MVNIFIHKLFNNRYQICTPSPGKTDIDHCNRVYNQNIVEQYAGNINYIAR